MKHVRAAVVLVGFSSLCACSGRSEQDAGAGAPTDAGTPTPDASIPDASITDANVPDASATDCFYLFQSYALGAQFPSSDGCNTCVCMAGGKVTCGHQNCWLDAGQTPCTPGADFTCNEDPSLSTILGQCLPSGVCDCGAEHHTNPLTGRCLNIWWNPMGNACEYGGVSHELNSDFPCLGSCDLCHCDAPGVESRTHVACNPDSGVLPCTYDTQYVFGDVGGSAPPEDLTSLGPVFGYDHITTRADGTPYHCNPGDFPACGDHEKVDVSDVMLAIMDSAVQTALSQQPSPALFGLDARAAGTPVFSFRRANSGEFLVGAPCAGAAGCVEPPAGVTALVDLLKALDVQARSSIDCDAQPTPGTFVCDNVTCQLGSEYCAVGSQNGRRLVAACRPFPAGCSSCECAKTDAEPLLGPINCAPVSGYHCWPGDNTLPDAGSVGLIVECSGA